MKDKREEFAIYVIDNFHPCPEVIRDHALIQTYEDWTGYDGQVYKRICRVDVPGVKAMLESLLGPIEVFGMGYRLNFNGELPNAAIHSDMGWGTHALVLYLSDGPSGTAFWTHKKTNAFYIAQGDTELFEQIKDDWNDESAWTQTRMVDMKFNRALIYENSQFHSRYPFEAFGDCPENGRLIVVSFFTPEKKI